MDVKVKPLVWVGGEIKVATGPDVIIRGHSVLAECVDQYETDRDARIRSAIIPPTLSDALELPEIKAMVEEFKWALDVIEEVQTYKQPDDPWTENALTMGELDVFEFNVTSARAALAALTEKE